MIDPSERAAIVGVGAVFPGAANPDDLWERIASGADVTREVPAGRWAVDPAEVFDTRVPAPDRVYSTRGGFAETPPVDADGLDLDPALVARLDPTFRLALEAGRQAWRDAVTGPLDRSRVGVVLGNIVLPTESTSALADEVLGRTLEEAVLGPAARGGTPGAPRTDPLNRHAAGLPAGLLAQALGLRGGAYTLDAACASSLYALKLAADEVVSGRADAMLTGGLSRPDPLYTQMGFSQLRALAPDGRARPFDAGAGGLVVGEGAGVFVLKRLSDALKHGDRVYGVVAAVGLSNDMDGGLLAPSSEGQLRAMRSAYERAGWDPRDVDLIECHATGTPVGDAVEFASLRALWGPGGEGAGRCVIGSHKANIGHALTASGAAGLVKVLMALRHETLPPTANFAAPGPKIGLEDSPFRILTAPEPWPARSPGRTRRAAVSGFGFGGINAHALIEEWAPGRPASALPTDTIDPEREADPEPIAVVGMGAHFGRSGGLRAFQECVLGGAAEAAPGAVGRDWGVFSSDWARHELGTEAPRGYHLDAVSVPLERFRIPPVELEQMLPQQSLALLAAADAIADAGWDDRPRPRAGVFIGIGLDPNTANFHVRWTLDRKVRAWEASGRLQLPDAGRAEYLESLRESAGPPLTANRTMGALGGLIASRVAREFRVGGPSFTVSSEETSGLRGLEVAVRLLRQGEIDEAVVGAVDLTGDPRVAVAATRAGLPPLIRGDGAAAVVLKRLDDARRDGDRVYAVVRGVGASSAAGIDTAGPDPGARRAAERRALEEAGDAAGVGLTERAHAERLAAGAVEAEPGPGPSSVAADQVGHTGAASGMASFVKAALALYQQLLPRTSSDDRRSVVPPRYWLHDRADGPRRARVEAVSVDGTCLEVLLEAPDGPEAPVTQAERVRPLGAPDVALFTVEADDTAGLLRLADRLAGLADEPGGAAVEGLSRRWRREQPAGPGRRLGLAVVASDPSDLRDKLAHARRQIEGSGVPPRPGVLFNPNPLSPSAPVALVFPGIGNHFAGMGRDLSARWPEVFRALDAETLRLRSQLAPGSGWDRADLPEFPDHRAPILGQVVLGTAVADLLARFGVRPGAVIGYSLGESSALFATRAWTERDLMHDRLDASALFRTELAGPCDAARRAWGVPPGEPVDWAAGVVAAPAEAVRAALAGIPRAYLLIANTPGESVVGGRRRSVDRLVKALGCPFLPLPVVSTVHCEVARQVESDYRALHLLTTTPPPGVRYYSAGRGRAYVPDRETAAEAIVAQAVGTVDFSAVVRRAYEDGVRVFLETGPGASCTRMIRATLGDLPHLAVSACVAGQDGVTSVLEVLGRLVAERVPVDLGPLDAEPAGATSPVVSRDSSGSRTVTVPVGGRPFAPPRGTPVPPRPVRRNGHPVRADGPHTDVRPTPPTPVVLPRPEPMPQTLPDRSRTAATEPTREDASLPDTPPLPAAHQRPADDLARAVSDAHAGLARAHGAFLRTADGLAQTMANHMAFQMALVEALTASPAPPRVSAPAAVVPDVRGRCREADGAEMPEVPPRALDRGQCLEFAVGSVVKVLGPAFAAVDAHPTRVRLPGEPLMLVDRVVEIDAEPLSMTGGRVVTEHDVLEGGWYLDCGRIPPCIAIESGQADLFLSGYLGVDFETKGRAVYRLLDAAVVFHRGLPGPGEVIRYDITISRFFHQGETRLFRFHFDASVNGEPLLTMRDGCAGFFSESELASGQGVVRRPLDLRPAAGVRPVDWAPLAPMAPGALDEAQVDALRRGDLPAAFGPDFEGLGLADPARLPGGRMTLVHRVPEIDPTGGRYGLGLIRGELDIRPDDWFLTCHFIDDQVMPGTLMYECCLHTLRVFLARMGWVGEAGAVAYEPVPGVASRLRCRGQVVGSTGKAVFEIVIKELGYRPEPYAIADALMYADGKPIVEVTDMSLRLTGLTRDDAERPWRARAAGKSPEAPPVFSREQVLAFALGKPSEAFGDRYRPFDEGRFIARLPAPPYSFLDRVVWTDAAPWVMAAGGSAVAEYDVPPDAWYFAANRQGRMPFAVLQEVSLQACGWLAAYMGSALTAEDDLAFRNLGGSATLLADVTPRTGRLSTRVTATRVSHSGGMIIQHYDFETRAGDTPVYRGSTYFGFFRRASLADQVGIREASPYRPSAAELARAREFAYPHEAPFPDDRLRMIDRVSAYVPDGGPHGLGMAIGSLPVDPSAWFFEAHFYQDPVCPGSLGLESLIQLLKVVAFERWGAAEADPGRLAFEPVGVGDTHRWLYRGQIVPADARVTTRAEITAVDDRRRWLRADGYVEVDGRLIYQMNDFTTRLV